MKVSSLFRMNTSLFPPLLILFSLFSGCAPIAKERISRADPALTFQQVFDNGGSTIADIHLFTFRNIHGEIMPMMAP